MAAKTISASIAALVSGCALCAALAFAPAIAAPSPSGGAQSGGAAPRNNARTVDPAEAYASGVEALNAENYSAAIRYFRQVLTVLPDSADSNYALAIAYIGNEQINRARRPLERAVEDANAPPDAHLRLGLIYLANDDRAEAEARLTALDGLVAACAAPECTDQRRANLQAAHAALANALNPPAEESESDDEATDGAATSWNFPSTDEGRAAYASAIGLINQQRYAEALDQLALVGAAIGPHPDVLNYQGFANRKLSRYDAALGYYQQALAINPDHLGANEYLGELYLELGRLADAHRQLERLDQLCAFGCAEREELARWIAQYASN
jgi:tetratricopeptide (TPR) repeat protein